MGFDDGDLFTIFGLAVRCTSAQQREIVARIRATPEYLRWTTLDCLIRTQHACADLEATFFEQLRQARGTAEALGKADVELYAVVNRTIDAVLGASDAS